MGDRPLRGTITEIGGLIDCRERGEAARAVRRTLGAECQPSIVRP